MKYCRIFLYRGCEIKADKNFKVDEIINYLNSLPANDIKALPDKYNYIKPARDIDVVISEDTYKQLDFGNTIGDYEYCSISYIDTDPTPTIYATYYFFITNKKWKSDKAVVLSLYMDTINSLKSAVTISEKSTIHRQHKDRLEAYNGATIRKIDLRPEGISPMLYKTSEQAIEDDGRKYYLVYKNKDAINPTDYNQVNPVQVQVFTNKPFKVRTNYITNTPLEAYTWNNPYKVEASNYLYFVNIADDSSYKIYATATQKAYIKLRYYNSQWSVSYIMESLVGSTWVQMMDKTININNSYGFYFASSVLSSINIEYIGSVALNNNYEVVPLIDTLDRSDSKLIKVIELPYSPFDYYTSSGDNVLYNGIFDVYKEGYLHLASFEQYKSTITAPAFAGTALSEVYNTEHPAQYNQARNDNNESKLYHSEFYQYKLVYDSFSKLYPFEDLDIKDFVGNWSNIPMEFDFTLSKNFSSKFVIKDSIARLHKLEDYEDVLVVSRNNELPIYTSQYINYVRNGFNFDVKNKERQMEIQDIKTGLTTIGAGFAIAGGIGALATGHIITGAGAIAGGITSIASSVISNVSTEKSLEDSIAQKLATAKAQALSISQADDVELLDVYANDNKAKYTTYNMSDEMTKAVADLFYYCGYKCEYQGIPDETSRIYFNFVMADIECVGVNVPDELLNDFKNRYKIGLTIIHKAQVSAGVYTWNFSQDKENWEVALL